MDLRSIGAAFVSNANAESAKRWSALFDCVGVHREESEYIAKSRPEYIAKKNERDATKHEGHTAATIDILSTCAPLPASQSQVGTSSISASISASIFQHLR